MSVHPDIVWLAAALFLYSAALYVAVFRIVKQHRAPSRIVNLLLGTGLLFHIISMVISGHPMAILAHVLSELAVFVLIIYFIMQALGKWGALAVFIIPTVIILSLFSLLLPRDFAGVGVSNILFAIHIIVSLAGIGGIFTGMFYTFLFVMQEKALKRHDLGTWFHLIPSLSASEHFAWRSLIGGYYLYTLGILLGFLWSFISKNVWFSPNPKNLGGVAAWVVFSILVLAQHFFHVKGRRSFVFYFLGFACILLAFSGIRLG
ncbi:MAG TPA: cytochrome c biogenesis protein CcsA [Thermoanaerobaculia bacterium]|nr:cytochrome c biogenesis protein CcsA [Thermoanaerobaculia bacterium]HXK66895.1 cytochrome c biogenesis protein CcsA [Thermoanaerobaculia bacterium]